MTGFSGCPAGEASTLSQFFNHLREGVRHIWIACDHILFLLSLLPPSVLVFGNRVWKAAARFQDTFWDVFKVVTSIAVAHSITLSLAALSVISLLLALVALVWLVERIFDLKLL